MDMESTERTTEPAMHQRRITLEDGRYMIFYTFPPPRAPPDDTPEEKHV
jgi:hypothetical protein